MGLGIALTLLGAGAAPLSAEAPAPRRKPGWQTHFEATLREQHAHPPRLVFLGDSIIQELRNTSPRFGDINQVWRRYYACRGALNLGFGGDTTGNVLWRLRHGELAGTDPRLVVVLIGTNDLSPRWDASPAQTTTGVWSVVKAVHDAVPHAHILLLGLLPRQKRNRLRRQVNRKLSHMAWSALGARYRDVSDVLGQDGQPDPAYYREASLDRPLLHPNAAGWTRIARAIEPEIIATLGGGAEICRTGE